MKDLSITSSHITELHYLSKLEQVVYKCCKIIAHTRVFRSMYALMCVRVTAVV